MVTVHDCQLRMLSIANALTVLGLQRESPQAHQVEQLRFGLEECMLLLATNERRTEQALSLRGAGPLYAEPGDQAEVFFSDLAFHARSLHRNINGVFRDVTLTATPSDNVQSLSDRYFEKTGEP